MKIAIAYYEGKPLTAWMLFLGEKVIYYPYGGSSDEHRNVMSTYGLVWQIIQWGRENGYEYLDLWGLSTNAKKSDKDLVFIGSKKAGEEKNWRIYSPTIW